MVLRAQQFSIGIVLAALVSQAGSQICFALGTDSTAAQPQSSASQPQSAAKPDSSGTQPEWQMNLEAAETASLNGDSAAGDLLYGESLSCAPDDTARATILNQEGVLRMKQHRFKDAERLFSQSLVFRRKSLGETDSVTLQTLSNFALATYKLGDEKKAEELYHQCIEAKRKSCPGTSSLANTLTNLAHLCSDERKCEEAKKLYLEALEIDSKNFGADHEEVANDLFNLGASLQKSNEPTEALEYLQKADHAYNSAGNKMGSVKALHYTSLCYGALKQYDAAAKASMQALHLVESVKGKGDPDTITHILSAANCACAAGDKIVAGNLYKQALETARQAKDPSNVRLAECNLELAQFHKKLGNNDQAELYFKKALVHYEQLTKKEKRSLYDLPLAYSQLLRELKRDDESDRLSHKYLNVYAPGP